MQSIFLSTLEQVELSKCTPSAMFFRHGILRVYKDSIGTSDMLFIFPLKLFAFGLQNCFNFEQDYIISLIISLLSLLLSYNILYYLSLSLSRSLCWLDVL